MKEPFTDLRRTRRLALTAANGKSSAKLVLTGCNGPFQLGLACTRAAKATKTNTGKPNQAVAVKKWA